MVPWKMPLSMQKNEGLEMGFKKMGLQQKWSRTQGKQVEKLRKVIFQRRNGEMREKMQVKEESEQ